MGGGGGDSRNCSVRLLNVQRPTVSWSSIYHRSVSEMVCENHAILNILYWKQMFYNNQTAQTESDVQSQLHSSQEQMQRWFTGFNWNPTNHQASSLNKQVFIQLNHCNNSKLRRPCTVGYLLKWVEYALNVSFEWMNTDDKPSQQHYTNVLMMQ